MQIQVFEYRKWWICFSEFMVHYFDANPRLTVKKSVNSFCRIFVTLFWCKSKLCNKEKCEFIFQNFCYIILMQIQELEQRKGWIYFSDFLLHHFDANPSLSKEKGGFIFQTLCYIILMQIQSIEQRKRQIYFSDFLLH